MTALLAAVSDDTAGAFLEIGGVLVALAVLARLAHRWRITPVPLYLVVGLLLGEGKVVPLDVSTDFIALAAEIGVLLLLLTLGLEYTPSELQASLRSSAVPGLVDAALGFAPGFGMGLLLGWDVRSAILLGGVCWISSSGVVSKVLTDLGRLGNRETPAVLNLLVLEDLAMAVYLPVVAALMTGGDAAGTLVTVAIALGAVGLVIVLLVGWGHRFSAALVSASDEALLLSVLGITLLVGGLAQRVQVSAAIGAFLVGLALSDPVRDRAAELVAPLRDLFAALFFLFFSLQVDPADFAGVAVPAVALLVVTGLGKVVTGWVAAQRARVGVPGRIRAGTALIARGEFSIVIAALGASAAFGAELAALAAAYVLLTAITGPLLTRSSDRIAQRLVARLDRTPPPRRPSGTMSG